MKFFDPKEDVMDLKLTQYGKHLLSKGRLIPKYYAFFDQDNFILAPTPDSNYAVELHYYYRPASLTAGSDSGTTWLSENAEMTLLYGAMIEAYIYMKGDQDMMAMYNKRFEESIVGIKMLGEAKETTDEYRTGKIIRAKQ